MRLLVTIALGLSLLSLSVTSAQARDRNDLPGALELVAELLLFAASRAQLFRFASLPRDVARACLARIEERETTDGGEFKTGVKQPLLKNSAIDGSTIGVDLQQMLPLT